MPKAKLVFHAKDEFSDGSIVEIRIWRLPEATDERPHGLKYSLFYGRPGERWIGYDNERGKGDHKHIFGIESAYEFVDADRLLSDFQADIKKLRSRT